MKTFKQYREEKKNLPKKKLPALETSFGKHSIPKIEIMETTFGKHSLSKVSKKTHIKEDENDPFDFTSKKREYPPSYDKHTLSHDQETDLHKKLNVPKNKMSDNEHEAISDYTDESRRLNSLLHRHAKGYNITTSNNAVEHKTAKHLDNVLSRQKTPEDLHVYTGVKDSPAKHFKTDSSGKLPEHANVNLPAYVSTSSSIKSARPFAEGTMHPKDERHGIEYPDSGEVRHIIKIHVPKGTNAMSLKEHSFVPEEKEVLLHRGHNLEIHHKPEKLDKDTYLWHAKITGHKVNDLSKEVE